MPPFRAFIGPVSLKPHPVGHRRFPCASFRAFIGPVSLKPRREGGDTPDVATFPGLHRPGLIEARLPAPYLSRSASAFRAFIGPVSLKLLAALADGVG